MEFRILGSLDVRAGDREIALGGSKQRAVLGALLLHANDVVSTEQLIDALWGERPPASAAKLVQGYVSSLRRSLGEQAELLTKPPGYVLRVEPARLDALAFRRLLGEAETASESGSFAVAAVRLREALELWRGPALADLPLEGRLAAGEARRLDELRLVALERRIDIDLALGRHAELIGELEALVTEHPLRERFHAQLMLALYRSQRQAEALDVYQRTRRALVEELGIQPGRGLQELEQAILRHDPQLEVTVRSLDSSVTAKSRAPRRRWVAAAIVVGVAVAAAVAVAVGRDGTPDPAPVIGSSVVVIDPATGSVVGEVPIGGRPSGVAVGEGSVWVTNEDDETLVRIDPRSRRVIRTIGLGVKPTAVAVGEGAVWVASEVAEVVLRVDPTLAEPVARIGFARPRDPGYFLNVAAGDGAAWVTDDRGRLFRIDPATNRVAARVEFPGTYDPSRAPIAVGDGFLWIGRVDTAFQVDRLTNTMTGELRVGAIGVGSSLAGLALGEGALWAVSYPSPTLARIDPRSGRLTELVRLDQTPLRVAVGEGSVWVATTGTTVLQFDPKASTLKRVISLGRAYPATAGESIAVGYGAVWVATRR